MKTEPETSHELSSEQLDEATGGATSPAPEAKPVRETQNTVQLLSNSTY
jgi:hypothetical protein